MNEDRSIQKKLLVSCLRAELGSAPAEEIPLVADRVRQWENIENLAEYHAVAPIVYRQLRKAAVDIPEPQVRMLRALALRHRHAHQVRSRCLREILDQFETAGIGILALKGAALAHLIYAEPWLRPMRDLDLLVDKGDLDVARSILGELGYEVPRAQESRYMGWHHHLPVAQKTADGLIVSVEIHHDAISRDSAGSITIGNAVAPFKGFPAEDGLAIKTLGHVDMLRHLCRHSFGPAAEIRLIHLSDITAYATRFVDEIDWGRLAHDYPWVINAIRCVYFPLGLPGKLSAVVPPPIGDAPPGVGFGMKPLSEILQHGRQMEEMAADLLRPPAWWMHAYYGVPPEESLWRCHMLRHPAIVSKWLLRRAASALLVR